MERKLRQTITTNSIAIYRKDSIWIFLSEVGFSIQEKQLGLPRRKKLSP